MRRECRKRFPRHRLQMKPLISNPAMHHGTYVTHVPWCMSGLLTHGGGKNVPRIPGACTTRNFTYLVRGPSKEFFLNTNISIAFGKHMLDTMGRKMYEKVSSWAIRPSELLDV